jgi:hypothetical protein
MALLEILMRAWLAVSTNPSGRHLVLEILPRTQRMMTAKGLLEEVAFLVYCINFRRRKVMAEALTYESGSSALWLEFGIVA